MKAFIKFSFSYINEVLNMKWVSICFIVTILSTLASSYTLSSVRSEGLSAESFLEDFIQLTDSPEEIWDFYDYAVNKKRDEELTIENILIKFNESQILFKGVDALSESKKAQELIVNATTFLLKQVGNVNLTSLLYTTSKLHLNVSGIYYTVEKSGLIQSTLDGILLDESYRPVLVKLVERIVYPNLDAIYFLMQKYLHPASNKKRADDSDSLEQFATNIISTVLHSQVFSETLTDLLNALNDTGVAVYTIKRLIASEQFQNLTVSLFKDIYATGAIKLNLSSLNISAIVDYFLKDPKVLTSALTGVMSGGNNLGATFGKYTDGVKGIIKDLEDDGFFVTLNDYLFSSSTLAVSTSSTTTKQNKNKDTNAVSRSKATTSAESSAYILTPSSNPVYKLLFIIQSAFISMLLF